MSTLALAIVNFVLAAAILTVILRLHVWAILTAHRDHVSAVEPEPVIVVEDKRAEVLAAEVAAAA